VAIPRRDGGIGDSAPVRKLLAAGAVILVLVAADQGARVYAQSELQKRAAAAVPEAASVHASVRSFPFVVQLLVSGNVSRVTLRFNGIRSSRLTLERVVLDLRGVVIDRNALIAERRGQLDRIHRGTVTVDISAAAVAATLGVDLRVSGGLLRLVQAGLTSTAVATVEGGDRLVLRVPGLPALSVVIPRIDLVPCRPAVAVTATGLRLSCTTDHIPPSLVGALGRAQLRG
jgi:hypothetical protein